MPFNYPVTEIYSATGERKCVFSAEEHAAKLAEGWLEERPARVCDPEPVTPLELELWIAEAPRAVNEPPAPAHKRRKK